MYKNILIVFFNLLFGKRRNKKEVGNYDRITLKIHNDNKFLGVNSDNKLTLVDYKDALFIKLNTMNDISKKSLEGKDSTVLTSKEWWIFGNAFSFQKNENSSKQQFRIVYYGPNEYILMKDDSCLGWLDVAKFKKVDCNLEKAAIFNICNGRNCDNFVDIKKELDSIKNLLRIQGGDQDSSDFSSDDGSRNVREKRSTNEGNNDASSDDSSGVSFYGHSHKDHHKNKGNRNRSRNRKDPNGQRNNYPINNYPNYGPGNKFNPQNYDVLYGKQSYNDPQNYDPLFSSQNRNFDPSYGPNNKYYPVVGKLGVCKDFSFLNSPFNQRPFNPLDDVFNGRHLNDDDINNDINGFKC